MEFMIITVYNWFAESRFFVGVHWMEFADTMLGISEQYLLFATRLGWLAAEFTSHFHNLYKVSPFAPKLNF
jgi:hypothetical protein